MDFHICITTKSLHQFNFRTFHTGYQLDWGAYFESTSCTVVLSTPKAKRSNTENELSLEKKKWLEKGETNEKGASSQKTDEIEILQNLSILKNIQPSTGRN